MRNHVFPSWFLQVHSALGDTPSWFLSTFQDDTWISPDPLAYRLAGDGFKYSWQFEDGSLPPSGRAPALVTFVLSCASAVDVPPLVEGSVVELAFGRPHHGLTRNPDGTYVEPTITATWIFINSYRVTGLEGVWDNRIKRWMLTVECSDLSVDTGATVDLGADDWDTIVREIYDQLNGGGGTYYGDTYAQAICRQFIATRTPLAFISRWHPVGAGHAAEAPEPEPRLNRPGEILTVADIVSRACASTVNSRHGRYILASVGPYFESLPFDPFNDVNPDNPAGIDPGPATIAFEPSLFQDWNGGAFLAEWNPRTTITAPPYELALDGDGDINSVRDASVDLEDNTDILILSASRVRISPQWRRDKVNSVNQISMSAWDTAGNVETAVLVDNVQAQSLNGISSRELKTLAYSKTTPLRDGIIDGVGAFLRVLRRLYTSASGDGSPWSPDTIDVLTNLMTDDELNSYAGRFNPLAQQQQTILIVDVDEPANPAPGPSWATLTGCTISIAKTGGEARLIVQPTIRPFMPKLISPAAATLNQIAATFPTKTVNDFDPELTLSQLALSHI